MAVSSPLSSRQTVAALLTLTAVTGLVDAVSYLRLGRVFVANMTGNVVFLGFSADPHSGLSAAASIIAIAGFLLGAACGRAAHALAAARPGHWLAAAFTGEALILGLVAVLTGTSVLPFAWHGNLATIAILAAALGVQNSTVRHLGAPDLTTTVLTLTLTGLTADSAPALGALGPSRTVGSAPSRPCWQAPRWARASSSGPRPVYDRCRPGHCRGRRLRDRHPAYRRGGSQHGHHQALLRCPTTIAKGSASPGRSSRSPSAAIIAALRRRLGVAALELDHAVPPRATIKR